MSKIRAELLFLGFTLLLLALGEVVHRAADVARLWAYVGALLLGFALRAALTAAGTSRRNADAPRQDGQQDLDQSRPE
ncbi:hypothetical protein GCM10027591_14150 [Zhihengliuella somnathii]